MSTHARIHFRLTPDADGYPPVAVETVWARPGDSAELFTLDSIPFFARAATFQDVVRTVRDDGHLWFEELVQPSENSLIRLVFFLPERIAEVCETLSALGCSTECFPDRRLVAVNVPRQASLPGVQAYVTQQASAGVLDYEEPILRQ